MKSAYRNKLLKYERCCSWFQESIWIVRILLTLEQKLKPLRHFDLSSTGLVHAMRLSGSTMLTPDNLIAWTRFRNVVRRTLILVHGVGLHYKHLKHLLMYTKVIIGIDIGGIFILQMTYGLVTRWWLHSLWHHHVSWHLSARKYRLTTTMLFNNLEWYMYAHILRAVHKKLLVIPYNVHLIICVIKEIMDSDIYTNHITMAD